MSTATAATTTMSTTSQSSSNAISSSNLIHNARNAGRKKTNPGKEYTATRTVKAVLKNITFGGKKTNPVWTCFEDLRIRGLSGVRCRYCLWITNDRSPTTLKFHLKRKHDTGLGGIWSNVEEKIYLSPSNIRLARVKNAENGIENSLKEVNTTSCYPGARAVIEATPSSSQQLVLDQLLQNVTSTPSFSNNCSHLDQENVFESKLYSDDIASDLKANISSPLVVPSVVEELNEPCYMLSDPPNVVQLIQVATEMNLTFTYNSQSTNEYCFESNWTETRGKMVAFFDSGMRVTVVERINGVDTNLEEWNKADWSQFLWAVRGKCMSALK